MRIRAYNNRTRALISGLILTGPSRCYQRTVVRLRAICLFSLHALSPDFSLLHHDDSSGSGFGFVSPNFCTRRNYYAAVNTLMRVGMCVRVRARARACLLFIFCIFQIFTAVVCFRDFGQIVILRLWGDT